MAKNDLLQTQFLDELIKGKTMVSIFLVNGIKLHGFVDAYDQDIVMLKNSVTQMVFKHAISTVVPSRAVSFSSGENKKSVAD